MIKERSRYYFVYQSVLTQIEENELAPGDSLPTAQQLCQHYGVGITTIRRVLRMLESSQIISCSQGRPALVVGLPEEGAYQNHIRFWTERGAALLDLCLCVYYLYPGLILEGASRWHAQHGSVFQLAQEMEHASKPASDPDWMRGVVERLLATLKNPILDSLCLSLRHWANLLSMALADHSCPESDMDKIQAIFYSMAKSLDTCDMPEALFWIRRFYQTNHSTLQRQLARMTGSRPLQYGMTFTWSGNSGRLHLYMDLSLKLMGLIAQGGVRDGDLLPSLAQMAQQYQVSEITVRKALAFLNELGLVHTINGKGTQITLAACRQTDPPFYIPALRDGVMNYLCTLQILALTCPDIITQAAAASPAWARAEARRLLQGSDFLQDDAKPVEWWLAFILRYTDSPGLRAIYGQLIQMLNWGHLLFFYRHTIDKVAHIRLLSQRVISCIAAGDLQGVGPAASAYYRYLFEAVRSSLPAELSTGFPSLLSPGKI